MLTVDFLGHELYVCCAKRAKTLWAELPPGKRWRLWSHDEWAAHLLRDDAEILRVVELKRQRPGKYLTLPEDKC